MRAHLKSVGLAIAVWLSALQPLGAIVPLSILLSSSTAVSAQSARDRNAEAIRLYKDGEQLWKTEQFQAALVKYQQALGIVRAIEEHKGEGIILNGIGDVYNSLEQYPKALEFYQQALTIHQKIRYQQMEGITLNKMADVHKSLEQYPKALELYQQALVIHQGSRNRRAEGVTLNSMGEVYNSLGQYPKALELYQQALEIRKEISDRSEQGTTLNNIGEVYQSIGEYPRALEFYQEALGIREAISDRAGQGIPLNSIGEVYYHLGKYSEALELYRQALAIHQEIGNRSMEGTALNDIGLVYSSLGKYSNALDFFRQALAIHQKGKYRLGEATTLNNIGYMYRLLGQYSKALEFYQQALAIHKEVGHRPIEAATLNNIGESYAYLGQYIKALEFFKQALVIIKQIGNSYGKGATLNNIGDVYRQRGYYAKALDFYQQALATCKDIGNRPTEGATLNNIGLAYYSLGQYPKALRFFQQALGIHQEVRDRLGERIALNNIGFFQLRAGKFQPAEENFFAALEIFETFRSSLTDANKISLLETIGDTYQALQLALIAQNKVESALEVADRARARSLVELLSSRQANHPIALTKPSIAQIKQIAQTQNATLVQYSIVSDQDLYIWVIQPNGNIAFHKAALTALKSPLNQLVIDSRDAIGVRGQRATLVPKLLPEMTKQQREQQTATLKQLHALLIAPIAEHLPKNPNDRVIFLPQGSLFLVPFSALQDVNGKYLIEQHTLLTAPSIQALEQTRQQADRLRQHAKSNQPNLVVGNPTMPKVALQLGDTPTQLTPLPGSAIEAQAIAPLLNTQPLLGAAATKATVLERMKTAQIIHLATHGFLNTIKGDVPGAVALAPNGTGERNDGLLTAGEIYDLFAQPGQTTLNADLVVLSACDTGRGDIKGEGVIGLSRTLFAAGVPSVIVSLWAVSDEPIAFLMTEFYKNWQTRKLDKAQALRQAILTTKDKDKFSRPLDWAAFTLIGEAE